jgi:hypothetical protein
VPLTARASQLTLGGLCLAEKERNSLRTGNGAVAGIHGVWMMERRRPLRSLLQFPSEKKRIKFISL